MHISQAQNQLSTKSVKLKKSGVGRDVPYTTVLNQSAQRYNAFFTQN